mmetsp:Transcript_15634/g.50119  ORF Transcript_15634/g.50119 Transcript_15634/m.50119 type:complete len:235 (+) Transcript_15634:115-819(+)
MLAACWGCGGRTGAGGGGASARAGGGSSGGGGGGGSGRGSVGGGGSVGGASARAWLAALRLERGLGACFGDDFCEHRVWQRPRGRHELLLLLLGLALLLAHLRAGRQDPDQLLAVGGESETRVEGQPLAGVLELRTALGPSNAATPVRLVSDQLFRILFCLTVAALHEEVVHAAEALANLGLAATGLADESRDGVCMGGRRGGGGSAFTCGPLAVVCWPKGRAKRAHNLGEEGE